MTLAERRRRVALAATLALLALLVIIGLTLRHDRADRRAALGTLRQPLSLVVQRDGFADIALQRDGLDAPWRIVEPCALAVDARRLQPLLDALNAVHARYPLDEIEQAGAGLLEPSATLVLDGRPLHIGDADVGGERRYLRDGDVVELVPEWILSLVNGGLSALADSRVLGGRNVALDGDDTEAQERWNTLVAAQIVAWPMDDPGPVIDTERRSIALADGDTLDVTLTRTERFVAIVADGAACARLVAPDAPFPRP